MYFKYQKYKKNTFNSFKCSKCILFKDYALKMLFSFSRRYSGVWKTWPKAILSFFLNLAHFEHLYISGPIAFQCRISLLEDVQNEFLHLPELFLYSSIMNILYKNYRPKGEGRSYFVVQLRRYCREINREI
jgi:hypothetical protein